MKKYCPEMVENFDEDNYKDRFYSKGEITVIYRAIEAILMWFRLYDDTSIGNGYYSDLQHLLVTGMPVYCIILWFYFIARRSN